MKQFIKNIILITLPILTILLATNYFGDAARLFNSDYEKEMAKIILSGKYVTNVENYDERLFQKELIYSDKIKPNFVIIGSSRTMHINSDICSSSSFLNNSVSGASLEDIISIYQLYKVNNKLPQKVIIGIDPWLFNNNSERKRWETIGEYYFQFINRDTEKNNFYSKYKELFSLSYFQSSLKLIPSVIMGKSDPESTKNKYNSLGTKLTDGSLIYGHEYRTASQKKVDEKINSYIIRKDIYGLEGFNVISDKKWKEFELLITDIKKNNIEVSFFISPYAPVVYERIKKDYPIVLKVEQKINNFSSLNKIKIYGSFNPSHCHLDKTFFYDAMHLKESGIRRIYNRE
jgi:hypothetical protein